MTHTFNHPINWPLTADLTSGKRTRPLGPPGDEEIIPACPKCEGDGCGHCLWTGLTEEDCDFAGLAAVRPDLAAITLKQDFPPTGPV